jgi:hypothetical protein
MAGLLGFLAAGAAKGYSDGRGKELAQKQDFDLRTALLDAQMDKELRLKEAGYQMEDKRSAAEMERNKAYMTGENGEAVSTEQAATKAMQAGDLTTAEKFAKSTPKRETFTLSEGQKVVDSSGKVIAEGNPKPEKIDINDMIFKAAAGDKQAQAFLDKQSAMDIKKAVAGRAPRSSTEAETRKADFIEANADNPELVRNGKLTSKGFDRLNKINNPEDFDEVTEKTAENDKFGSPIKERTVKSKVLKRANDPLGIR